MPIPPQALASDRNRYLVLTDQDTLRQAFVWLTSPDVQRRPWWHLLVRRGDGTWAAAKFSALLQFARKDPTRLDLPLERVTVLHTARTVERTAMGIGQANIEARKAPGRMLVVTEGGELAGIFCAPALRTKGPVLPDFKTLLESTAATPEERHTDVSCPRKVGHQTERFNVVVRLRRQPPEISAAHQRLKARAGEVEVEIRAAAFEILGAARQTMKVPSGADSPPVVFDLRPREIGHHQLTLDFFQAGDHLGIVAVAVEVVTGEVAEVQVPALSHPLFYEADTPAPDMTLRILHDGIPRGGPLMLSLIRNGGAAWQDFAALPLEIDPEQFARESLRDLTLTSHHVAEGRTPTGGTALPDEIDHCLKTLGQNLWRDLFPQDFKDLYARERRAWRDRTLLILSDEPHVPWEMVWPYGDDWEDDEPWCLTLRLSRWLRRDPQGNGNARSPGRLALTSLACLAPQVSTRPTAQEERDFLHTLAQRHGVDASPDDASWKAVRELLETGRYDWLHVVAHGTFHAESPDQYAALWLDDDYPLAARHFVGPSIEGHLSRSRPAFFFNACSAGRLSCGLTRLGGWASRLLSSGAGLFLGPLWPVEDKAAFVMARTLYDELEAGETIAEACRRARRAARRSGDPSWLAYSLYAHPNARITPCPDRIPRPPASPPSGRPPRGP